MLDIKKYYLYCMGEGYLDKRRFGEDLSLEKATQRVFQGQQDETLQKMLLAANRANPNQSQPTLMASTPFQQMMFSLLRPVQVTVSSVREWLSAFLQKLNLPQQQTANPHQAPKGNLFERLLAQVFGFFKPKQKATAEEKEREQRFLEDHNDESIWGRRFVESSSGAGSGGGQK
jgi:hypothetical protein